MWEGKSVNSGLDYWTGLLDWTTGLTSYLNCPGHNIIENASHARKNATSFPGGGLGMRVSRILNNRIMRLRAFVSVLMEITHTSVTFAIWHMEVH